MTPLLLALLLALPAGGSTLLVPQEYPTIGQAIAAASDGDTVLVSPGTYVETIRFHGKAIEVRSVGGAAVTRIDANEVDSAVRFQDGERRDSVLAGFTITRGWNLEAGGGILIEGAAPTIRDCTITDCFAWNKGGGIHSRDGAPLIQGCLLVGNTTRWDAPGIHFEGSHPDWAAVVHCVVVGHSTVHGDLLGTVSSLAASPVLVVNTISRQNDGAFGVAIHGPGQALHCNFEGADGSGGNLDVDPQWVDAAAGDHHLLPGSPCRDAGAGAAALPTGPGLDGLLGLLDLDGEPRVSGAAPDIGVDELVLGALFCAGDGGGAPCPCANVGLAHQGCASGSGEGALLTASGSTSVAAGDLVLHGVNLLPGNAGLFFEGAAAVNGGLGVAFGDGLRCVGSAVARVQVGFPTAEGTLATTVGVAATTGALAGQTRRYQLWYRDALTTVCGTGFNLSNGLELVWQP